MTSVLALEQPGRWRLGVVVGVFTITALPAVPLFERAVRSSASTLDAAFWTSLQTSGGIAVAAAVLGLMAGAPLGIAAGLYDFRGRRALVVLAALPLLLPSFLWAIGWSTLAMRFPHSGLSRGLHACVLVGATTTASLIFVTSWAAVRDLSRSQVEAARLAGGEPALLRCTGRHVVAPALLAAALGGVLTLADPGPGQIFGVRTVASEILTSFASRHDVGLAARQSVVLTVVVLSAAIPLALIAGPRLAHAVLGRQSTKSVSARRAGTAGIAAAFSVLAVLAVGLPVAGLLAPLAAGPWPFVASATDVARENWERNHLVVAILGALGTTADTATDTLLYAGGAGLVATTLGLGLALAAGRSPWLRSIVVGLSVALLAWPPAASALGVMSAATAAPAWLDPIVRSRLPVCVLLGLRFAPVSAVLAMRAWGATAPSWVHAAAVHGVPFRTYVRRIAWPALRPSVGCSMALVGLLASAEVGVVLLLHPPGEASLPLAIFTIMANAPETTVAALCLVYMLAACTVLLLAVRYASRHP